MALCQVGPCQQRFLIISAFINAKTEKWICAFEMQLLLLFLSRGEGKLNKEIKELKFHIYIKKYKDPHYILSSLLTRRTISGENALNLCFEDLKFYVSKRWK